MKRLTILSILAIFLISCEEVIEVDLQPEPPRLVVNGLIRVDESQEFVDVRITVTETSNFFGENTVTQLDDNALIFYGIPDENNPGFFVGEILSSSLSEAQPGTGIYTPDPTFDEDQRIRTVDITPRTAFILQLEHRGRRYTSLTTYIPTVPIDNLEKGDATLFDGDETEIKVTFTDFENREDYYVFDFGFNNFLAVTDQFFDGQEFEFSYFYDEEFESGSELEISILGADLEFFNYMDLLIEQSERDAGIFETPVATVRGNVFDVTGLDNINIFDNVQRPSEFALGYFAVVQEYKTSITLQ